MNRTFTLVSLVSVLFVASAHSAETDEVGPPKWEISPYSTAALASEWQGSEAAGTTFSVSTVADYFVAPTVEFGPDVGYTTTTNGGGYAFHIYVGPTLNFSDTPESAFYVSARAGLRMLELAGSGHAYDRFTWIAAFGKRIPLVAHLSWSPEVSYESRSEATDDTAGTTIDAQKFLSVTPFKFSLLF